MFARLTITARQPASRVAVGARAVARAKFGATPDAAAGGSSYENYSETSKTYDNFREPIGLDILRKALADNAALRGLAVTDYSLLDAGCGSGNYLAELQGDVGSVTGLEFNEGMIKQAAQKLGDVVQQGSITDMPFEDNTFDAAMTTQVLHHLEGPENRETQEFNNVAQACKEVARCLKPGGIWMVSTQTPEQHLDGFWWAPVVPTAAATLAKHFAPMDLFKKLLTDAGFETAEVVIPPVPLVREDLYLNVEGPFDQAFRNADSTWSLATDEELAAGLAMLKGKIEAGEGEKFLAEREAIRAKIGQTSTVIALKPLA